MATTIRPSIRADVLWQVARATALIATALLLGGLFAAPEPSLDILWNLLIPIVPASLLLAPMLWRNVCPLATANMLGNGLLDARKPPVRLAFAMMGAGLLLFYILVPARRLVFNTDGPFLAVTITAIVILALILGMVFDKKSGFCNAICPVLPVERIYGVRPLFDVASNRCEKCSACITACIDLTTDRSLAQLERSNGPARPWRTTPFGWFAAAFPGFIIGYFQVSDMPLSEWGTVYGTVAAWALGSTVVLLGIGVALKLTLRGFLTVVAPLAAGLYYWYASPAIADTWGLGDTGSVVLRTLFLGIVFWWSIVNLPKVRPEPA